jgi:hypothetical protein
VEAEPDAAIVQDGDVLDSEHSAERKIRTHRNRRRSARAPLNDFARVVEGKRRDNIDDPLLGRLLDAVPGDRMRG